MPRVASPRGKKTWTEHLDPVEIGVFGLVEAKPEEFFDENGIREKFFRSVTIQKRTKFKPQRGQIIGMQFLRNGSPVSSRRKASHIRYDLEFSPRKEMLDIASKALGIRDNYSPPDLRCRPPRKEVLGFAGMENLAEEYPPDPDDESCDWDRLQEVIDYVDAKLGIRPDLVHPIGE